MYAPQKPLQTRDLWYKRRALRSELASGKRVGITTLGTFGESQAHTGGELIPIQEEQRCKATVPLYPWRTDTLRPDRMSQAPCLSPLCGQKTGLPGDNATTGREPGSLDSCYKFPSEVYPAISLPAALADSSFPLATSITQTNMLLGWLFAPSEI